MRSKGCLGHLSEERYPRRRFGLVIHAQHLLRVFLLGSSDESLFHRCPACLIYLDNRRINAGRIQERLATSASFIVPQHASERNISFQDTKDTCDASGATKALLDPVHAKDRNWRFRADAVSVAPDVPIKHQVADDKNARAAEVLDKTDQGFFHGRSSGANPH
jgi:hypothetical protein